MANANRKKSTSLTVSKGLAERLSFIRKFKHRAEDLEQVIEQSLLEAVSKIESKLNLSENLWKTASKCPLCSSGVLFEKKNTRKPNSRTFIGCSRYPSCKHTESVKVIK